MARPSVPAIATFLKTNDGRKYCRDLNRRNEDWRPSRIMLLFKSALAAEVLVERAGGEGLSSLWFFLFLSW